MTLPTPKSLIDMERDAWCDLVDHADRRALAAVGLTASRVGAATILCCRAAGPLLNRTYDAAADSEQLVAIRTRYEAAGVPLYFLYIEDAERAPDVIERAGLIRYRRGMVYVARDLAEPLPAAHALDISRPTPAELLRGTQIFCAAFDADRALAPVLASMYGTPGWHFLVARMGGEPVALGILYVAGERAILFGGATAPAFRQRGAQAALVAARVVLARELGCTWIGGHTGEPVADDPQHSFHNMMRAGLTPIGRADSYTAPGIVWTHGRRRIGTR